MTALANLLGGYTVERAGAQDVSAIVCLLIDDELGRGRESDLADPGYAKAFAEIDTDPNQLLVVVRDQAGPVVGTLQLTRIPGLSRAGATRVTIEGVRVAASLRGKGIGSLLVRWAVERSQAWGAKTVQLTSDRSRVDAHRFYQRLGFVDSHVGMKLML